MKNNYVLFAVILVFGAFKSKKINWTPPPDGLLNDCLDLPEEYFDYVNVEIPDFIENLAQQNDNEPGFNPVTNAGATLGRVLFYDKKLSINDEIACASCHLQEFAFTDTAQFSRGFEGGLTGRNSMDLSHSRYYPNEHFFWDERAATLEDQVLMPIQDQVEMGMNLDDLIIKLEATEYYGPLFEDVFGTPDVTSDRIAVALAQFVRSMESYNSKYDIGRAQVMEGGPNDPPVFAMPFPNFTMEENIGKNIFFNPMIGNCASCHIPDLFIAPVPRNNGLDLEYADNGIGAANGNLMDNGKFKVPSLRNVALTAPYMHDGRFEDLDEVIQHYDNGVLAHPNLANQLKIGGPNGPPRTLGLDQSQKDALKAFLLTLTDSTYLTDEKWSDPFCESPNSTKNLWLVKSVKVFPNPFKESTTITIDNNLEFEYLRVLDINGIQVFQQKVNGTTFTIERNQLVEGMYFIELSGRSGTVSKRVMVQ